MVISTDTVQPQRKEISWNKGSNSVSGTFSKRGNVTTMILKEKYNLSFLKDDFSSSPDLSIFMSIATAYFFTGSYSQQFFMLFPAYSIFSFFTNSYSTP